MKKCFLLILLLFFVSSVRSVLALGRGDINFSYLDFLKRQIKTQDAKNLTYWCIYARPGRGTDCHSPYVPHEAKDEGIACVDDVSRVAVAYIKHYNIFHEQESLRKAKEALDFVCYMQDADGLFYNFIKEDGSINKDGKTSAKSLDWWTVRAFWSLSVGYRAFKEADASYGRILEDRINLLLPHFQRVLSDPEKGYGKYIRVNRNKAPAWLIRGASDVTSIAVLGLLEYYRANPREDVAAMIRQYCKGLAHLQGGDYGKFPYLVHYSMVGQLNSWHLYGNFQISALAQAYALFREKEWLESAEKEANALYTHLLVCSGPIFGADPYPEIYPQMAYSAEVMTTNLLSLYRVTGKELYARLAGLAAGWLFGNNYPHRDTIYDPRSGRCYDGLGKKGKNTNSGCESTVEALLTLLEIWNTPSDRFLEWQMLPQGRTWVILEAEDGKPVRKDYEVTSRRYSGGTEGGAVKLSMGDSFWIRFEISQPDDYDVYLCFLRQDGLDIGSSISLRIDGDHIYTVPSGGAPDAPYITMERVVEQRRLLPGTHSLGVRFGGLLHSRSTELDCILLQPLLEWRLFRGSRQGSGMLLLKNMGNNDRIFDFEEGKIKVPEKFIINSYTCDGTSRGEVQSQGDRAAQTVKINVPAHGCVMVFW